MKALNSNFIGGTRAWWVILAVGILMVLCGFAYWFWPQAGYAIASQIFGWLLILAGVVQLCVGSGPNRGRGWGWWLAGGVTNMFIGFMLVRNIFLSEAVFPYFLAFVFIFWGIEALIRACYNGGKYWWIGIINGILMLLIGFFFLEAGSVSYINNESVTEMVSFLTSIAFIYWGFTLAVGSYELRPVEGEK